MANLSYREHVGGVDFDIEVNSYGDHPFEICINPCGEAIRAKTGDPEKLRRFAETILTCLDWYEENKD